MNKLCLPACCLLLLLAACRNRAQDDEVLTDKLKAAVQTEEKVNKVIEQLRKDCDSTLLQEALYRADSIRKARQRKNGVKRK
jgi:uncharacterized membrane protein